jgi:hypothetical protein
VFARAWGQVLALGYALDTVVPLDDDAANTIDCEVDGKTHPDGAAADDDDISLHKRVA